MSGLGGRGRREVGAVTVEKWLILPWEMVPSHSIIHLLLWVSEVMYLTI